MAPYLFRIPGISSRLRSVVGRPGDFRTRLRLKDLKRPRQNRFIAGGALSIDAIEKELLKTMMHYFMPRLQGSIYCLPHSDP